MRSTFLPGGNSQFSYDPVTVGVALLGVMLLSSRGDRRLSFLQANVNSKAFFESLVLLERTWGPNL